MHHKILLGPGKIYEFCFFFWKKIEGYKNYGIIGDMDVCTSYI